MFLAGHTEINFIMFSMGDYSRFTIETEMSFKWFKDKKL